MIWVGSRTRDFNRFTLKRVVIIIIIWQSVFLSKINCVRNFVWFGFGAQNNGKCGGGFRKGTARRRRRCLFGCFCLIIYIYLFFEMHFFRTSISESFVFYSRAYTPWIITSALWCIYNINIIYAVNTPRHADIKHYDLHSNWNEISTKVDWRRRIEIYSCRWFLSLFGYALIIWFAHWIQRKKYQAAHI